MIIVNFTIIIIIVNILDFQLKVYYFLFLKFFSFINNLELWLFFLLFFVIFFFFKYIVIFRLDYFQFPVLSCGLEFNYLYRTYYFLAF
jgi:hypothetical protein